jgi:hypothetical protein
MSGKVTCSRPCLENLIVILGLEINTNKQTELNPPTEPTGTSFSRSGQHKVTTSRDLKHPSQLLLIRKHKQTNTYSFLHHTPVPCQGILGFLVIMCSTRGSCNVLND